MLETGELNFYYEDCFQLSIERGYNFNMTVLDFTGYNSIEVDTMEDYNLIQSII